MFERFRIINFVQCIDVAFFYIIFEFRQLQRSLFENYVSEIAFKIFYRLALLQNHRDLQTYKPHISSYRFLNFGGLESFAARNATIVPALVAPIGELIRHFYNSFESFSTVLAIILFNHGFIFFPKLF